MPLRGTTSAVWCHQHNNPLTRLIACQWCHFLDKYSHGSCKTMSNQKLSHKLKFVLKWNYAKRNYIKWDLPVLSLFDFSQLSKQQSSVQLLLDQWSVRHHTARSMSHNMTEIILTKNCDFRTLLLIQNIIFYYRVLGHSLLAWTNGNTDRASWTCCFMNYQSSQPLTWI